jgi:hypothetical protein
VKQDPNQTLAHPKRELKSYHIKNKTIYKKPTNRLKEREEEKK